jgi:hypothetical protein
MDLQTAKALFRIYNSPDGEYLMNFLQQLSESNYKSLKYCDPHMHAVYVGRAQGIDEIKDFIINAEKECIEKTHADPAEWSL